MILDNIRDTKLMQLYTALTHSDFKGNYEDTFIIEMLFAVLVIDLIANGSRKENMKAGDMVNLAKEVLRIYETDDGEMSYLSIRNWTEGLMEYMEENNKRYKDIHKMATYDLRKEVREYLKQGDE